VDWRHCKKVSLKPTELVNLYMLLISEGRCINNIVTKVIPRLKRTLNMADSSFNFVEFEHYGFEREKQVYEIMEAEYAKIIAEDNDGIGTAH
jgi:hypothetical protein